MLSSNDKKGNYMKCMTMGIDNYLIKPIDISELQNIIQDSFPFVETENFSSDSGKSSDAIRILIVEDNKMNQKVLGTMLKSLGYSFDLADDGYAGYMLAKATKYDLIFMDLVMPEMDGYQSARKILESDNKVLIVAFTADNMPDSKRKAELSGIREFISKPVRIDELKKLFAKYFNQN
jgi:CheY-like chemotaxis protein